MPVIVIRHDQDRYPGYDHGQQSYPFSHTFLATARLRVGLAPVVMTQALAQFSPLFVKALAGTQCGLLKISAKRF